MLAGILRRIRSLEQRALASKVERLPRPPIWWLTKWEQHLGVPVDEYGQPKFAAIQGNQAEQRAAADSISAGPEERRSPDVMQPSKTEEHFD